MLCRDWRHLLSSTFSRDGVSNPRSLSRHRTTAVPTNGPSRSYCLSPSDLHVPPSREAPSRSLADGRPTDSVSRAAEIFLVPGDKGCWKLPPWRSTYPQLLAEPVRMRLRLDSTPSDCNVCTVSISGSESCVLLLTNDVVLGRPMIAAKLRHLPALPVTFRLPTTLQRSTANLGVVADGWKNGHSCQLPAYELLLVLDCHGQSLLSYLTCRHLIKHDPPCGCPTWGNGLNG